MLSLCVVVGALVDEAGVGAGVLCEDREGVAGSEEGGVGLRSAVKSTADEERCIRARSDFVPQDDRLSWGESGTK